MSELPHILAESDPIARFIGIALVVGIWIVGMIAQAVKNQKEKSQRQAPPELAEAIRNRLPPPVVNRPPRAPKQKRSAKQTGRPNWQSIAAPPPVPHAIHPEMPAQPVVRAVEGHGAAFKEAPSAPHDQPPTKKPVFVDAGAVRRWLKPQTLQQQFILTELLQKPKCLREDD